MKHRFLVLMMLIFSFSIIYAANGDEEFLKANEYYKKNDYSNAEKMFLESIKKGNIRANYNLATLYLNKKEYKKAEKYYLDVLEKGDRKDTELISATIFNLGQLDLEIGEYGKAEYMFKFLADKFPKDTIYSSKLGAFYFVQGKYSEAEKYLKQALNYIKNDKNLENKVKKLLEEIDKKVKK